MKINGKYQPGGIVSGGKIPHPQAYQETVEAIIPLDRLHELMTRGDRRRQHMRALVMIITESLLTAGITTAYYCSLPVKEAKDKFVKIIADLQIEGGAYMNIDDEIQFNNGSKIKFISSAGCGNFHIIAPHPIEWGQLQPWVEEAAPFNPMDFRFRCGTWKNNSDEANPL
jgi:hypothetical protein